MKILMLVNWKVQFTNEKVEGKQSPDYYIYNEKYWFFKHFKNNVEVDVIDIRSCKLFEYLESKILKVYVIQCIKALIKIKKYDVVISHGVQSGIVLALIRRLIKTKAKHIVFDIGSFNSAAETGLLLKMMQFASKSIDGLIYHTKNQINYYKKCFPWLVEKSQYIRFGTDIEFFDSKKVKKSDDLGKYMICVGYSKRDWNTLIEAYKQIDTEIKLKLKLVGHKDKNYEGIKNIEQVARIPINDLINEIYNAKFCILPLEWFNYSFGQMTLLQQMALEKCVITSNVPSVIDYITDKSTAVIYKAKDVASCKEAIEYCLNADVGLIGKNARKYLEKNLNEKTMAVEVENFIQGILNERDK